MYIPKGNPDNHAFHFSKNSLCNLLVLNKFRPVYINRYIDSDCLFVIAKKINSIETKNLKIDNYKKVKSFSLIGTRIVKNIKVSHCSIKFFKNK